MKKTIIIVLALVLALGGVIYYFVDRDTSYIAENNVEDNVQNDMENNDNKDEDRDAFVSDIAVGEKLPDFTLKNLNDEDVSPRDFEGKILLVNFWATWCKFCDEEMPDLQRLSEENDDLVVLGVNVQEDKSLVQKYIDEGGYDFEVVLDIDGEVATDYLVSGLPNSYFANEEGIFIGRVPGMINYDQMNEIIEGIRNNQ